jgi:hypothetical protein
MEEDFDMEAFLLLNRPQISFALGIGHLLESVGISWSGEVNFQEMEKLYNIEL